jgi:hypothetical protein
MRARKLQKPRNGSGESIFKWYIQFHLPGESVKAACVLRLVFFFCPIAGVHAQTLEGQFALQGQNAQTEGRLKVTPIPGRPLSEHLDFWMQEPGKPKPIRDYQVEMTKKLHMIIVGSDFNSFMHEHPTLGPDGHLTLTQEFPKSGTYLIYTDGLPNQLNHQVFRFQVDVGAPSSAARALRPTGMGVQAGPYEVDLSSVRLRGLSQRPGSLLCACSPDGHGTRHGYEHGSTPTAGKRTVAVRDDAAPRFARAW